MILFYFYILIITTTIKLTTGTTYTITTSNDILQLSTLSETTTYDTIILESDIDMTGITLDPIGDGSSRKLKNVFEGNGHLITNLSIESSNSYVGLMGYMTDGTIQNIVLDSTCSITSTASVTSSGSVGGILGYMKSSSKSITVQNVVNMASVKFMGSGSSYAVINIGGIIGSIEGSNSHTISNCVNYGTVSFKGSTSENNEIDIGGIVGNFVGSGSSSIISNAINYGTISVSGASTENVYMGGIAGCTQKKFTLSNLINFGSLSCSDSNSNSKGNIGGIIGYLYEADSSSVSNGLYWTATDGSDVSSAYGKSSSSGSSISFSQNDVSGFDDVTMMLVDGTKSLLDSLGDDFVRIVFDEEGVGDMVLLVSDPYPVLPTPTRSGSPDDAFLGWYLESSFDTEFSKSCLKAGTLSLYGKWTSSNVVVGPTTTVESSSSSSSSFISSSSSSSSLHSSSSSSSMKISSSSSIISSSSSILSSSSSSSVLSSSSSSMKISSSSSSSSILSSSSSSIPLSLSSSSLLSIPISSFSSDNPLSSLSSSSSKISVNVDSVSSSGGENESGFISSSNRWNSSIIANNSSIRINETSTNQTQGWYIIYIFDKFLYSIRLLKVGDKITPLIPDTIAVGYQFNGWYTDENLTHKMNITVMPSENITLYGESITELISIVFDTHSLADEGCVKEHIIKLFDDICSECFRIVSIINEDGKVSVIIAFKDTTAAKNFLEVIQTDPNIRKVDFVSPFPSNYVDGVDDDDDGYGNDDGDGNGGGGGGGSDNSTFIALIVIFAILLAAVIIIAFVMYPILFLVDRNDKNSDEKYECDDIEKNAGIEMTEINYDSNDNTLSQCTYPCESSLTFSNVNNGGGNIVSSVNNPFMLKRIVPEKSICDSIANPATSMKIDSFYDENYILPKNTLKCLEKSLISAGISVEILNSLCNDACCENAADDDDDDDGKKESENDCAFSLPIKVYTYENTSEILNDILINGSNKSESDKLKRDIKDLLFLVMSSLRQLELVKDLTLYCGSRTKCSDVDKYHKDNCVFLPGFLSATTNVNCVKELICGEKNATLFVIERAAAYKIDDFYNNNCDGMIDEFLIEPERQFRVKEIVKESKKLTVVTLVMVDSPPPKVFDTIL